MKKIQCYNCENGAIM